MVRKELLNSAEYWQEMAENECWGKGIECKIQLIDGNKQWHKVEDELPPRIKETVNVSKAVLVTDGTSYGVAYYNYALNVWRSFGFLSITHWQPLPEFPKKEE